MFVLRLYSRITTEREESLKHCRSFLMMQGNSEPQRGHEVTVRQSTRVQLSGDAMRFMKSLGYRFGPKNIKVVGGVAHC